MLTICFYVERTTACDSSYGFLYLYAVSCMVHICVLLHPLSNQQIIHTIRPEKKQLT
jgi:hypothetical protein